jgi:adenylate cyclase
MVLFNDPLPYPDPAERAVRLAVAMREAVAALAVGWRKRGHHIGFGVAIAQGYATIGCVGYEGRFDYSAIGTVPNLAARLCAEAKDGEILVSARVAAAVEAFAELQSQGEMTLKGLSRPTEVSNVVALSVPAPAFLREAGEAEKP